MSTPPVFQGWPSAEAYAGHARLLVEGYEHWDTDPAFLILEYDGEVMKARSIACLNVPPEMIPMVMAGIAADDAKSNPGKPACGYALQLESWTAPHPDASADEETHRKWHEDATSGGFHARDDRVELAQAFVASVRGDLWRAVQMRDGDLTEEFVAGGNPSVIGNAGGMIDALVTLARVTGQTLWPTNLGEAWTRHAHRRSLSGARPLASFSRRTRKGLPRSRRSLHCMAMISRRRSGRWRTSSGPCTCTGTPFWRTRARERGSIRMSWRALPRSGRRRRSSRWFRGPGSPPRGGAFSTIHTAGCPLPLQRYGAILRPHQGGGDARPVLASGPHRPRLPPARRRLR